MSANEVVAIIPAAGSGTRLREVKQFLELDGVPLLALAVRAAASCSEVGAVVVAAPPGREDEVRDLLKEHRADAKLHAVVAGGAERADSVRAAIAAAPAGARYALIHDAARPFASAQLFSRVLGACKERGAAIAAIPCTDTVKQTAEAGGRVVAATVDRQRLWLAQTPQGFRIDRLEAAWEKAGVAMGEATDEAALIEAAGWEVELVPGEKENFKVTDAEDWERAKRRALPQMVVGFGYDVHAFEEGRPCVLGGVEFPGEVGLAGHSDADAISHAITDAVLGAAGMGDIGQHFPDSDERFKGASSIALLEEVVALVRERGFRVQNVDLTIAAARPRIGPRRIELQERLAKALGVEPARVNVKATTTEGLGFVGRSEGVAAQAVALLAGG